MVDHGGHIPSGKDVGMGQGLQGVAHLDKALIIQGKARIPQPVRGGGICHPKDVITPQRQPRFAVDKFLPRRLV